jgi:hypothetical protein
MARPNKRKAEKIRLNIRLPMDLSYWAKRYAHEHNTNVTQLIVDYFTELKKNVEAGSVPQF